MQTGRQRVTCPHSLSPCSPLSLLLLCPFSLFISHPPFFANYLILTIFTPHSPPYQPLLVAPPESVQRQPTGSQPVRHYPCLPFSMLTIQFTAKELSITPSPSPRVEGGFSEKGLTNMATWVALSFTTPPKLWGYQTTFSTNHNCRVWH